MSYLAGRWSNSLRFISVSGLFVLKAACLFLAPNQSLDVAFVAVGHYQGEQDQDNGYFGISMNGVINDG